MERLENVLLAAGALVFMIGVTILAAGAVVYSITGIGAVASTGGIVTMVGIALCGCGLIIGLGPSLIKVLKNGPAS